MGFNRLLALSLPLAATLSFATPQDLDEGWPQWRGPTGNGVALDGDPPVEWSEEQNIRWKIAIPGLGSSTPVILGDRIYVTSAIETDREGNPAAGTEEEPEQERGGRRGSRRGGRGSAPPSKIHEFVVLCYDRANGKELWRTLVAETVPHEAIHSTATQVSNSPLTDGEFLYAHFGSRGLHCLDLEGKVVWSVDFGLMRTRNQFGEGSSPALFGDTLVVPWDHEGDSFIAALNKKDGKELWRRDREEPSNWTTPYIVEVGDGAQVIIPGTTGSIAYDLKDGKTIWTCTGMTGNVIPIPTYGDGVVHLMSGFRGAALQAIRLEGAKGELVVGESENIIWTHDTGTSYTPSALLYDGLLYFLRTNSGVASCLDAVTGEIYYEEERLDGIRTVYSSPVGVAERVYITSREGTTVVLEAGDVLKVLATNELDDGFDASAAVVGDEIYLRGMKSLYCIANTAKKE